jgi:hypothetical protein
MSKEKPYRKVAILGFAPSWVDAPFKDESFEIWALNEMYKLFAKKPEARADKWFEIHSPDSPSKNTKEHRAFLQNCQIPLYMWDHSEEFPNSVKFPKDELLDFFGKPYGEPFRYFTNSISWMIAFAIYERYDEIHVYGVDMAADSEYGFQRPSCEYFLGVAAGMGIKLYIPKNSDLLKATLLYGFETDNAQRIANRKRQADLKSKKTQYINELSNLKNRERELEAAVNQIDGALQDCKYWMTNWMV